MRRMSMTAGRGLAIASIATLVGVVPLLTVATAFAQETAGKPNDPSPALGHAQVIAHGVAVVPADEVAWRVVAERATLPRRATASLHPPGFALADSGVLAVTDRDGNLLTRVAPGEAAWLSPTAPTAVVSLEEETVGYYDIALVPAQDLADSGQAIASAPFTLPAGVAFDVALVRDVLTRNEEADVAAGAWPGLLLVTKGSLTVSSRTGEAVDLAAGETSEIRGDAVVRGDSRAPAAFVLAQLGPQVPRAVALQALGAPQPTLAPARTPTPMSTATPAPTPTPPPMSAASVGIASFICPVAYAGGDYAADCHNPSSRIEFTVSAGAALIQSSVAGPEGRVAFSGLEPGDYVLAASVPGDFASSRVRCLNAAGDDIARRHATNQIALSLLPGDQIVCAWYIVPEDARGEEPAPTATAAPPLPAPASVAISSFTCPVGYEGGDYPADCVSPAAGVEFSLTGNGAVVQQVVPAGADGDVAFQPVVAGEYVLVAGVPGDFASSRVRCLNAAGEDIARRFATNQVAVTLPPGESVACNWYIVPVDARGEG